LSPTERTKYYAPRSRPAAIDQSLRVGGAATSLQSGQGNAGRRGFNRL